MILIVRAKTGTHGDECGAWVTDAESRRRWPVGPAVGGRRGAGLVDVGREEKEGVWPKKKEKGFPIYESMNLREIQKEVGHEFEMELRGFCYGFAHSNSKGNSNSTNSRT